MSIPVTGSERNTDHDGVLLTDESERTELAGLGMNVPFETGSSLTLSLGVPNYKKGGFIGDAEDGCVANAMEGPGKCSEILQKELEKPKRAPPTLVPVSREELKRRKKEMEDRGITVDDDEKNIVPLNVDGVRAGITLVWQNQTCRDLITQMLAAVSSRRNPLESGGDPTVLFDRLSTQGGISRKPPPNGEQLGGAASGLFKDGDAAISAPAQLWNSTPHHDLVTDVKTAVDELMHLSGSNARYTDREFADVVKKNPLWAQSNGNNIGGKPVVPQTFPDDVRGLTSAQKKLLRRDHVPYSGYWHPVLENLCYSRVNFSSLR